MSPDRMIKIAKLVAFDDLKHLSLSELLWFPSFLTLAKQCEDPSAITLQPTLQSKFESKESDQFAYFHKMKPITTTIGNINGGLLI